jgi:hypothetical protein
MKGHLMTTYARAVITRALAIAIVLIALVISARAMHLDLSNTWCARHQYRATGDRMAYYAWIDKCHRRRGTRPCFGLLGEGTCEINYDDYPKKMKK